MDRPDYSMYLEEKEVLLQAGLRAKVESFEEKFEGRLTIFNLYISDQMVVREKRKRTLDFAMPVIIYGVHNLFTSVIDFCLLKRDK